MRPVWIGFCATMLAFGQEPDAPIKVDVSLVNVAFIVRDWAGNLARQLTKDDVEIYEDGVRQQVKFFSRSGDLPLRLGLVVDVSGSQDKFNKQHKKDIEAFLNSAVTPRDQAMLICFGNRILLASDFSASVPDLMQAFHRFERGHRDAQELDIDDSRSGGTALFDAVFAAAISKLRPLAGERKALLLFSDGQDNSSAHDLMDAIEAAQIADAPIYTIRYTEEHHHGPTARDRYGMREMDRLARETGAAAFDASKRDVSELLAQVGEELRSMYDVGYTSSNPQRDGRFRKVEIRVKREGMRARTKPGYFAR
jgi:Ca-activated chloride channel family protein